MSISILFFLSLLYCSSSATVPLLLVISLDGFRWDYPNLYHLPHFDAMHRRGVRAQYLQNDFATVTFASHMTIATGLYQEVHGIVANQMYDRNLNFSQTIANTEDTRWWSQNHDVQPIWISNQLANDSSQRRSGVIGWPGGNVMFQGRVSARYQPYNGSRSFESTLTQIIDWFRECVHSRINFGLIYNDEPDETGHNYGPISSEMNRTLAECDRDIGRLLDIIDHDDYLKNHLNVIVTSDHGIERVFPTSVIALQNYTDTALYAAYGGHTFKNLFVHSKWNIDHFYQNLSSMPYSYVYKKSDIPFRFHYQLNDRIGDILVIAKLGYRIVLSHGNSGGPSMGEHGFSSDEKSMQPIFYAFGPAFRQNLLSHSFHLVDLYPLMSHILQLPERSTNGSLENVQHLLIDSHSKRIVSRASALVSNEAPSGDWIMIGCIVFAIVLAIVYGIVSCRQSRALMSVEEHELHVQYRILHNNDESMNNLVMSESENETDVK